MQLGVVGSIVGVPLNAEGDMWMDGNGMCYEGRDGDISDRHVWYGVVVGD
jgi:hypothetical protein